MNVFKLICYTNVKQKKGEAGDASSWQMEGGKYR